MVMKHQLAALAAGVVALLALLLALLEPAAAGGLQFTTDDLASDASLWELYERWGARYNVARDPAEKLRRFQTFKETALRVASRAGVAGGRAPGLNAFADLSADEFDRDDRCRRTTTLAEWRNRNLNLTAPPSVKRRGGDLPLPVAWDWRDKTCGDQPCLGPVKDQGYCGSC
ncbi:cysteine endopeptidase RepA-like [Miscanthus floridulus]|uniref:cysteine endopeptidase RepA-like n=1 Tax=Miscanthus floridulus TaxID=154761 RepID=UPI003457F0B6